MTIVPTPLRPLEYWRAQRPMRLSQTLEQPRTPFERFRSRFPDFVASLQARRAKRDQKLGALSGLSVAKQRALTRKLLHDRELHRIYAYDALRRTGRRGDATPASVEELAVRFNAFAPVHDEPAVLRRVARGSGWRLVHDFGPRRRMQQALVAGILRQLHPPLQGQTLFNGGMPTARKAVALAYRDGMHHGVEVDFVDFYGSIAPERLAELLRPLPASVVDNVV